MEGEVPLDRTAIHRGATPSKELDYERNLSQKWRSLFDLGQSNVKNGRQWKRQKGLRFRNPLMLMVGDTRFELATNGLKVELTRFTTVRLILE